MKFNTKVEITTYFNNYREEYGKAGHTQYTVPAKKALCVYMEGNVLTSEVAAAAKIGRSTLSRWMSDNKEGLFDSMDGVTSVSRIAKAAHGNAVQMLLRKKDDLEAKTRGEVIQIVAQVAAIQALESAGFKVSCT